MAFQNRLFGIVSKNNLGLLRRKYQESHGKRFVKATGRLFKSDKKGIDVSNYVFAEILYQ